MREAQTRYAPLGAMLLLSLGLSIWVASLALPSAAPRGAVPEPPRPKVETLDAFFEARWGSLRPSAAAPPLLVFRRLSLALRGAQPSLQEIRRFEAELLQDKSAAVLDRWAVRFLDGPRFAEYFSRRLARAFVGVKNGDFIRFRRDRFVAWLRDSLKKNTPYDRLVLEMIDAQGLWTDTPQVNFITQAIQQDQLDPAALAGRTARIFLGQRIDCAKCHDHPYEDWTQDQFEGLAAHFGQARLGMAGVRDDPAERWAPTYANPGMVTSTAAVAGVEPSLPFGADWLGAEPRARTSLARWVVHDNNRRFRRAAVNRIWGLMFGRALVTPVDELDDPDPSVRDALDVLGDRFAKDGYDLRRLIRLIAASRPFGLGSRDASQQNPASAVEAWAVFPLARLRPEQLYGALLQSSSLKTIDPRSGFLVRGIRFLRGAQFVRAYGDLGEDELSKRSGTVAQALLRMNGKLPHELSEAHLFNAAGRIFMLVDSPQERLESVFLTCLTRRPTEAERAHFAPLLVDREAVEDLYWTLINAPEFSWNH